MLLEDFNRDNARQFRKINKLLKEQFSVTLSAKSDSKELAKVRRRVAEDIQRLKSKGKVSNTCPELARNLLMLEGIDSLAEQKRLDELRTDFTSSGPYQRVIDWLSNFIVKNVEVGDDIEDATEQAMKEYRSSKWRFPDDHVRFDARSSAIAKMQMQESAYMAESVEECDMTQLQGADLSQIMTPDEVEHVKIFIIQPDSELDPSVRGKINDFYSQQGQVPGEEENIDDFYYNRIANDFGTQLRGEMDEAAWDDILDKSARYKSLVKDPSMLDKHLKGSTLSMAPHDDDGGRETTHGAAMQYRKSLAPKRVREMKENFVSQLRALLESEIDEAEIVIAVKGIGKSLQEMIEKIGRLQNEDLPPLSDQVRDVYDVGIATGFQESTSSALQSVLDSLYQAKDEVDLMVQSLASGAGDLAAGTDMDADLNVGVEPDASDVAMGDELDAGLEMGDELDGLEDEFGGMDAASGPEDEPLGRARKESVQSTKRKIAEMQRMVNKAKKLKERK